MDDHPCLSIATGCSVSDRARVDALRAFWQRYVRLSKTPGATTWENLDYYYSRVDRCLGSCPPDIDLAESITARALLEFSGVRVV